MRWRSALATLVALAGLVGSQHAVAQSSLVLKPPAAGEVTWRGMLPTEGSGVGGGANVLYPAPGLVGLLVVVLTHAAINEGVQSAARKREQEDADRVLAPYLPALREWTSAALWEATLKAADPSISIKALGTDPAAGDKVVVEAVPVFTVSQDEAVLIADVAIKRLAPGATAAVESVVRIISSPHKANDARAHWLSDEARRLKEASALMLAHAIELNERQITSPDTAQPMRTFRYLQGAVERSERAQMLSGDCARAVLRTLRGWVLSVPLSPKEGEVCAVSTPF